MTRHVLTLLLVVCIGSTGLMLSGCGKDKPEDEIAEAKKCIEAGDLEKAEAILKDIDTAELEAAVKTQLDAAKKVLEAAKLKEKAEEVLGD